ncbi:syntaxin-12 [Nephila pilipes]|uniref:Syntaxin-12 n=1 Tax=Nephila pilipes TaxID=299642 RepID=A0A8X6UAU5_NEPPI|nr:syntaxin-12 [Nephila pilipes]
MYLLESQDEVDVITPGNHWRSHYMINSVDERGSTALDNYSSFLNFRCFYFGVFKMSFGRSNFPDYGATDPRFGAQQSRSPQNTNFDTALYNQLCDEISCNIFSINNNVSGLEKAYKEVGTQADTPLLREKIHATRQSTKDLVSNTTKCLKSLTFVVKKGNREHKLQSERVRNEFQATVQRYDTLQKQLDPKMKHAMMQNPVASKNIWNTDEDEEQQALVDSERNQQYQIQEELEFEQGLLLEREQRIRQIETDMLDVNKVFLDLAAMVREQGETIGTIEENITAAAYNVEGGTEQLLKARNYQKAYRKKLCCFVLILVIVTIIITIILSVSLNS